MTLHCASIPHIHHYLVSTDVCLSGLYTLAVMNSGGITWVDWCLRSIGLYLCRVYGQGLTYWIICEVKFQFGLEIIFSNEDNSIFITCTLFSRARDTFSVSILL